MVRCKVCDYVITQPLCGSCLAHEIEAWLSERNAMSEAQELKEEIMSFLNPQGPTTCIKCGAPMGVCNHCILSLADSWLLQHTPYERAEFRELFGIHPRLLLPEKEEFLLA